MLGVNMITIANIFILLALITGVFFGYLRGFQKSITKLILYIIFISVGWLISPLFSSVISRVNFEFLNIKIQSYTLTSIDQLISEIINKIDPKMNGLLAYDSNLAYLTIEITNLISRLLFLSVWIVFSLIFIQVINNKISKLFLKKQNKRNRPFGMVIGLLQTLLFLFIASSFISGFCSVQKSIEIINYSTQETIAEEKGDISFPLKSINSKFKNIFYNNYRQTYMGSILEIISINETAIDEYVFDKIFSFENIEIRKEISQISFIYQNLSLRINGYITIEKVLALEDEYMIEIIHDVSKLKSYNFLFGSLLEYLVINNEDGIAKKDELLKKIGEIDHQKDLYYIEKTITHLVDLGLLKDQETEFYFNLDSKKINELCQDAYSIDSLIVIGELLKYRIENDETIKKFLGYDQSLDFSDFHLNDEIKNIGVIYSCFKKLGIVDLNFSEIDFSLINDEDLNALARSVFESKFLKNNSRVFAKAIIKYFPKEIQELITINNIETNDFLNLMLFGKVVFSCGFLNEESDPSLFFENQNIEKVANYISSSSLMSENVSGILKIFLKGFNFPSDFILDIPSNINWNSEDGKNEIINLFVKFKELNIQISREEELVMNFETLSYIIFDSRVLVHNINNILDYIIKNYIGNSFTLIIDDYNWEEESGQKELKAFISAVGVLIRADLISKPQISNLSDGSIDTNSDGVIDSNDDNLLLDMSIKLSKSQIIRKNLSNLLIEVKSKMKLDFDIAVMENPDEWTQTEIYALLKSMKIIESKKNLPEDLFGLNTIEINQFLDSKVMVKSIIKAVIEMSYQNTMLVVRLAENDEKWFDNDDYGEIRKLLYAINLLYQNSDESFPSINPNVLLTLNGEEINILLQSQIISDTFVKFIKDLGDSGKIKVDIPIYDNQWYGQNGELIKFIEAIKIILKDQPDLNNINLDPNVLKTITTGDTNENSDDLSVIFQSKIATDTIINTIKNLENVEITSGTKFVIDIDDENWLDSPTNKPGELRNLIRALQIIFKDPNTDLNNPTIDPNFILNISDGTKDTNGDGLIDKNDSNDLSKILKSKIISDSIIRLILDKYKNMQS